MRADERKFNTGFALEALSAATREFRRRAGFYLALIVIFLMLAFLADFSTELSARWGGETVAAPIEFLSFLLVDSFMVAAFTMAVVAGQKGVDLGVGEALQAASRCFLIVAVAALVKWVMIGVGLLLAVAPGVFLFVSLFVCLNVAAAESARSIAAVRRSIFLTKAHIWPLFLLSALYVATFSALYYGISELRWDGLDFLRVTLDAGFALLTAVVYQRLTFLTGEKREADDLVE